jgi:TatD DNase family protein
MLVDTHCHLDFNDFAKDLDDVVERAKAKGVGRIINVGSSVEGTRRSIRLAERYDIVYATIGVHPHEAASVTDSVMTELKNLAASEKVVAVGEVGLDYYRNLSPKEAQAGAFRKFIRLALDLGLPLILHAREANNDLLGILKEFEQPLDFARGRRTTPRLRSGQANDESTASCTVFQATRIS